MGLGMVDSSGTVDGPGVVAALTGAALIGHTSHRCTS
jgi:hypothetical protein